MKLTGWIASVLFLLPATAGAAGAAGGDEPSPGGRELFRRQVRPMLQEKCLGCHGDGEELEAALDLRDRESMLRGGKSGPALVPGNPRASLIYRSLTRTDEKVMPPRDRGQLSAAEIDALRRWIEAGAPWAPE